MSCSDNARTPAIAFSNTGNSSTVCNISNNRFAIRCLLFVSSAPNRKAIRHTATQQASLMTISSPTISTLLNNISNSRSKRLCCAMISTYLSCWDNLAMATTSALTAEVSSTVSPASTNFLSKPSNCEESSLNHLKRK